MIIPLCTRKLVYKNLFRPEELHAPIIIPESSILPACNGNKKDDSWMSPKREGSTDIKIIGWTPDGKPAPLPTSYGNHTLSNKQNQMTDVSRIIDPITDGSKVVSLMNATVRFDYTKPGDPGYDLGSKMRSIAANVQQCHSKLKTDYKPIPLIEGLISYDEYEELLAIYENNQVYYQEKLDDMSISLDEIKCGLTVLEYWFITIIEPEPLDKRDVDDWKNREKDKFIKRRSPYCDPLLYEYIDPAPIQIINTLKTAEISREKQISLSIVPASSDSSIIIKFTQKTMEPLRTPSYILPTSKITGNALLSHQRTPTSTPPKTPSYILPTSGITGTTLPSPQRTPTSTPPRTPSYLLPTSKITGKALPSPQRTPTVTDSKQ